MRRTLIFGTYITALTITLFVLGSCVSDPDSSGLEYMPDMYRAPSIEVYVDNGEIRGKRFPKYKTALSALTPPNNSIPYYGKGDSMLVKLMLPYARKGMMGAHNSLVTKKEIWTLVHYVRQFQNPDYGKFDKNGNPKSLVKMDSTVTKTK